jgi:hypothetical protein
MDKALKNRYYMYLAVAETLKGYREAINQVGEFSEHVDKYESNLQNIKDKQEERESSNLTLDKEETENNLIEAMLTSAAALRIFASLNSDQQLKEDCSFSRSELTHMRDADLDVKSQQLTRHAESKSEQLKELGLDESDLAKLQKLSQDFNSVLRGSKAHEANKVTARKELKEIFKDNAELVTNIDDFVMVLRHKFPDLYNDYQQARNIKDI